MEKDKLDRSVILFLFFVFLQQQQMSSYPDLVAYHSIAVTLGQAGHMKELFDVIDTMRSPPKKNFKTGALGAWDPRVEPDVVVYNAVRRITKAVLNLRTFIFNPCALKR